MIRPLASPDESFPARMRIKQRSDFKQVSRRGRRRTGPHLIVYAQKNALDCSRLGLTVSRKVGKAAQRNRWKRRLREVFRRNKKVVPIGWDFVVIVKKSAPEHPEFEQLSKELLTLMTEASATSP